MQKYVAFSLVAAVILLVAGPLHAGEVKILDITPPASNEPIGNFEDHGILHQIDSESVVIGDALFRRGPGVTFHNYDGTRLSQADFPVGIRVWYVLYPDNTIKSLWKEGG